MAILSALMLTRERGELLGFRADELVVGSRARAALGEFLGEFSGEPFGEPVETLNVSHMVIVKLSPVSNLHAEGVVRADRAGFQRHHSFWPRQHSHLLRTLQAISQLPSCLSAGQRRPIPAPARLSQIKCLCASQSAENIITVLVCSRVHSLSNTSGSLLHME